jgi:hypothetical protein
LRCSQADGWTANFRMLANLRKSMPL